MPEKGFAVLWVRLMLTWVPRMAELKVRLVHSGAAELSVRVFVVRGVLEVLIVVVPCRGMGVVGLK